MRDFLVYCPCREGVIAADLFHDSRTYDVMLNDYTGSGKGLEKAEDGQKMIGHKWPVIAKSGVCFTSYRAVLFLDDDIEIDVPRLNNLFAVGVRKGLSLWQAALTPDSRYSWPHLVQQCQTCRPLCIACGNCARPSRTVEIMMPCFSQAALSICFPSFSESQSGWGLDDLWPQLLDGKGLAVIDGIPARHARPVQSGGWRMPNGKTPQQERDEIIRRHGLNEWQQTRGLNPWKHI